MRITYIGHSTVLLELDGLRVLTDPVLRGRVAHIRRWGSPVDPEAISGADLVLVSHMHHDHFDPPSLRMIDRQAELVLPRGGGKAAARLGFRRVTELGVGEAMEVEGIGVSATHAEHRPGRLFDKRSAAVGFMVAGTQRVYFAGDTDIFQGMRELGASLDVALLPVWGWGPNLGSGHLIPSTAAEALTLLEPRVAVPIHWGTLYRIGLRRSKREPVAAPPQLFAQEAARLAPAVDVRILDPGDTTTVEAP